MNNERFDSMRNDWAYQSSAWRWATLVFGAFVVAVILSADLGMLPTLSWVKILPGGDFTCHAILIGTLAFFAGGYAPGLIGGIISRGAMMIALLILVEELSQLWLEHRSFSLGDLLGNALGIIAAESLRRWGYRYLKERLG